ncbi:RNA-binding RNA processing protein rpp1 [Coemansia sp. Benny D115]|nr:RNA-binding RNA processing protein rpp1 [Coemansia sp. Benny D115]
MEVLNRQEALLTNYETLLILQEEDERHKQIKTKRHIKYPENVTTLKFEALQYLNNTPCTTQSEEQIANLKSQLVEYELTKAEILQIINLRPKSPVELHLIIEECGERFEMEDLEQLLAIILEALPRDDDEDEAAEDEQEEGGGEEMEVEGCNMFYDLNIALPEVAGRANSRLGAKEWEQVTQAVECARDLGYSVVALNQTVQGRLTAEHLEVWKTIPAITGAKLSWDVTTGKRDTSVATAGNVGRGKIRVLRRVTAVISEGAQGHSLSSTGAQSVGGEYDIVAVRPTSEKLLLAASNGSWEGVDLISLDTTVRWGFFAKHKTMSQALALGLGIEIMYGGALEDASLRQQWVSNAAALVRVTRGRNLLWTSAAKQAFALRAPYDVVNLGEAVQLNADLTKRAISSTARAVLQHAFTRAATLRAVISVKKPVNMDEDKDAEGDVGGDMAQVSKRQRRQ